MGKGEGTALPGLLAEKYCPSLFTYFARQLPPTVIITGTNGKTTTRQILSNIVRSSGQKILTNSAGANLKRGLIAEFIKSANLLGVLDYELAILEIEEATLPKVIKYLDPKVIIVTNLFRDQLDAYGEINITHEYIEDSIKQCPNAKVILNIDDSFSSAISESIDNPTFFVETSKEFHNLIPYERQNLKKKNSVSHNTVKVSRVDITPDLVSRFELKSNLFHIENISLNIPGFFHIYNAAFAATAAHLLGIQNTHIQKGIESVKPAFGRGERIDVKNKTVRFFLIKNPAGFSLTLNVLAPLRDLNLLIIINDNIADGRDVSWLWDANIEYINNMKINNLIISGTRAFDMGVRIKYAWERNIENLDSKNFRAGNTQVYIEEDIKSAMEYCLHLKSKSNTLFVLPTYTALLELRRNLGLKIE